MEYTVLLGDSRIYIELTATKVYVRTTFPDGTYVEATPNDTEIDRAYAASMGYSTVQTMTLEHDLLHSFLAVKSGKRYSPTLWNVAHRIDDDETAWDEEERVKQFNLEYRRLSMPSIFSELWFREWAALTIEIYESALQEIQSS